MNLQQIKERKFKVSVNKSGATRINQTEQTELKMAVLDLVTQAMAETYGDEIELIKGAGSTLLILQNDEEGSIPLTIEVVTKPLDFDIDGYQEEYQEKLRKDAEKKAKAKALAEARKSKTKAE